MKCVKLKCGGYKIERKTPKLQRITVFSRLFLTGLNGWLLIELHSYKLWSVSLGVIPVTLSMYFKV